MEYLIYRGKVAKLFIFDNSVLHYLRAMTFKSMPVLSLRKHSFTDLNDKHGK